MTVFTESHSELLLAEPWLAKSDEATNTTFLFKFHADYENLSCCFLITDTKRVWFEVLESRHVGRRSRQCNNKGKKNDTSSQPRPDEEEERQWRLDQLTALANMLLWMSIDSLEFSVSTSDNSDLEVHLNSANMHWRWDVNLLGKMGAEVLSQHLILPMMTLSGFALNALDLSPADLTKKLDSAAHLAKLVGPSAEMKKVFAKPRMTSALRRVTQKVNGVQDLAPIVSSFDEVPPPPAPPQQNAETTGVKRRRPSSPIGKAAPKSPSPSDSEMPSPKQSKTSPSKRRIESSNEQSSATEDEAPISPAKLKGKKPVRSGSHMETDEDAAPSGSQPKSNGEDGDDGKESKKSAGPAPRVAPPRRRF